MAAARVGDRLMLSVRAMLLNGENSLAYCVGGHAVIPHSGYRIASRSSISLTFSSRCKRR